MDMGFFFEMAISLRATSVGCWVFQQFPSLWSKFLGVSLRSDSLWSMFLGLMSGLFLQSS